MVIAKDYDGLDKIYLSRINYGFVNTTGESRDNFA